MPAPLHQPGVPRECPLRGLFAGGRHRPPQAGTDAARGRQRPPPAAPAATGHHGPPQAGTGRHRPPQAARGRHRPPQAATGRHRPPAAATGRQRPHMLWGLVVSGSSARRRRLPEAARQGLALRSGDESFLVVSISPSRCDSIWFDVGTRARDDDDASPRTARWRYDDQFRLGARCLAIPMHCIVALSRYFAITIFCDDDMCRFCAIPICRDHD